MQYKQLTATELKETIYRILEAFADYCDANGLYYSLSGGTLLGAVRHQDFIPWDDDIDVCMPRYDYMKLMELAKEKPIGNHYQLISYENGTADFPFAKVIDLNTKVEERCTTSDKNLWIDVFPVDGLKGEEEEDTRHLLQANKYKRSYARAVAVFGEGTTKLRAVLKTPALIYHKLIGKETYAKKIHELCLKYPFNQSDYIASAAWTYGPQERMPREEYLKRQKMFFHEREFYVMGCWEYYLSHMFGDYMTLPPENKRINHLMDAYIEKNS